MIDLNKLSLEKEKRKMEKGFHINKDGDIYYLSNKYYYSILEGKTKDNKTSDIAFIYKEPIEIGNNLLSGKVITFLYGGIDSVITNKFGERDFIEKEIEKFESMEKTK